MEVTFVTKKELYEIAEKVGFTEYLKAAEEFEEGYESSSNKHNTANEPSITRKFKLDPVQFCVHRCHVFFLVSDMRTELNFNFGDALM